MARRLLPFAFLALTLLPGAVGGSSELDEAPFERVMVPDKSGDTFPPAQTAPEFDLHPGLTFRRTATDLTMSFWMDAFADDQPQTEYIARIHGSADPDGSYSRLRCVWKAGVVYPSCRWTPIECYNDGYDWYCDPYPAYVANAMRDPNGRALRATIPLNEWRAHRIIDEINVSIRSCLLPPVCLGIDRDSAEKDEFRYEI